MLEGQRLFASLACLSYQGPSLSEPSLRAGFREMDDLFFFQVMASKMEVPRSASRTKTVSARTACVSGQDPEGGARFRTASTNIRSRVRK